MRFGNNKRGQEERRDEREIGDESSFFFVSRGSGMFFFCEKPRGFQDFLPGMSRFVEKTRGFFLCFSTLKAVFFCFFFRFEKLATLSAIIEKVTNSMYRACDCEMCLFEYIVE